jgi:antitoxin component YwqK of YwqJK toxin-antitoxin module
MTLNHCPFLFYRATVLLILLALNSSCKNQSGTTTVPREEYEYYNTGEPEKKFTLVEGKREGPCEWYFKDGRLKGVIQFANDLQDGKSEYYYPNGKLREVQYYQAGKQTGWDSIWYPNGQLFQVNHFVNGKLEGDQYHYDSTGQLKHHGLFQADTLVRLVYSR